MEVPRASRPAQPADGHQRLRLRRRRDDCDEPGPSLHAGPGGCGGFGRRTSRRRGRGTGHRRGCWHRGAGACGEGRGGEAEEDPAERAAEAKAKREERLQEQATRKVEEVKVFTTGSYLDTVDWRARRFLEKAAGDAGFAVVLVSMFLLGVWFVRSGVMDDTAKHLAFFHKLALFGLPVGIGLGLLSGFIAMSHTPGDRYDGWGIARGLVMLGNLPACLGYVGLVVTMLHSRTALSRIRMLAPVGRMALTNYLMQSLICITFFYGFGLGTGGCPRSAGAVRRGGLWRADSIQPLVVGPVPLWPDGMAVARLHVSAGTHVSRRGNPRCGAGRVGLDQAQRRPLRGRSGPACPESASRALPMGLHERLRLVGIEIANWLVISYLSQELMEAEMSAHFAQGTDVCRLVVMLGAVAAVLTGCGGSGSDDVATSQATTQAAGGNSLIAQGRTIFRLETFGDEAK